MSRDASVNRNGTTPIDSGGDSADESPPQTPRIGFGKMMSVRVQMLDDSITLFQVQSKAPGRILFDQVCKQLNLLEVDYFGLEYKDNSGITYWLDVDKQMNHQVSLHEALFLFCVKFYTPDPAQIEEEYTRYLFSLQIKRDLSTGTLQCNDNTAALMASYIVQAECGDYVYEDYPDHTYLSSFKFVPQQDHELERRIMENHKKHVGQSPAEADLNLLETARRCELYGTKMHSAKDHEGVPLNLAVANMGVIVFQNYTKINTFSWAKIRKLSFKRKKYLIKLHPEGYGYYKDTVEFYFDARNQCKNFWKKCVEHHGFFRCTSSAISQRKDREKRRLISRGSSFRYTGKTQKEMQEFVRENFVKRQSFQRHVRQLHSSMGNVSSSLSAQPLLPLGDGAAPDNGNGIINAEINSPTSTITSNSISITSPTEPPSYQSIFAQSLRRRNDPQEINGNHQSPNHQSVSPSLTSTQIEQPKNSSTPIRGSYNEIIGASPSMARRDSSSMASSSSRLRREDSVDGILSPLSISGGARSNGNETDTETRKKRYPTDRAYFIAKEILMTERTYKKDLEVINSYFRDEVGKESNMPDELLTLLFSHFDPIYEIHCTFLKDIEQRMATWEGRGNARFQGDYKKIGDIVLRSFDSFTVECYLKYIDIHVLILDKMEANYLNNPKYNQVVKDFESQKVCYLPLTTLLLKPLHRILHYELLLQRLLNHYNVNHHDWNDSNLAMKKIQGIISKMSFKLKESENLVKMAELSRDIGSFENLQQPDREFLREGCLQKLSRKGYQQRMFFLFSDILLYANRTTTPNLQFRIHGQLSVKELTILDSEPRMGAEFCFNIYDGKKALLVSASHQAEKNAWMEDITEAAQFARENGAPDSKFTSLKSMSGSEDGLDRTNEPNSGVHQRTNSSVHVCWHRHTSVSLVDYHKSMENCLSGYLLRKFKNSNGWQKLWVVFTNSCLYFFKTFQDEFPLASLPLLGYAVNRPTPEDNIQKDYVFKLQFKNHVYFFRAESQYTYDRWIEVLSTATKLSGDFIKDS